MNNAARPGSIHRGANYIKPQIIKETKLKRTLRYNTNVKIKQR